MAQGCDLMGTLIADKCIIWQAECETRFQQLKANEEELNRISVSYTHLDVYKRQQGIQ